MRVLVIGAGLMGTQIGCEYALGGHEVTLAARREQPLRLRLDAVLADCVTRGLRDRRVVQSARERLRLSTEPAADGWDLVVESLPESLPLKLSALRPLAEGSPTAILATNTSSLSVTALGEALDATARTVATHYWNPPLLMPLVEVVPARGAADGLAQRVCALLRRLGKQPVLLEREVPGFIWNRLQAALLRECVWLAREGVTDPKTIDNVVRLGCARRWRLVGPFEAAALGGAETWNALMTNLLPSLSGEHTIGDLTPLLSSDAGELAEAARRRDGGLAAELAGDPR